MLRSPESWAAACSWAGRGVTGVRVDAVGENDDEHIRRALNRPYYYGYAMTGKTIYVYTKEEWGIGASSGGGDHT